MAQEKMTSLERRSVCSLATIMSLRLIGLFMILPIFTLYAHDLTGATPFLIGVAMGIYGLTQGLFQIPFGMLSDHVGRKPMITIGLILFGLGSILAATAHSIHGMIIGRALQGAGAIGSTIIAMIADLTRESQRTKAMAINGITIGVSFSLAMVAGPILAAWMHVSGVFWLASLFSIIAIILLFTLTPTPEKTVWHADAEVAPAQFWTLLKDAQLMRLNSGVFILHAIFTASFIVIPISFQKLAGLPSHDQWQVFLPALVVAFIMSICMIGIAEKKRQLKAFFIAGIILLALAEICLLRWPTHIFLSAIGLFLFFTAFSLLEACLPSWVSRIAPRARKGTALGIYSCSQFLGIFLGGSVGGWLYGSWGLGSVYLFCILLTFPWLTLAFGLKNLHHTSSHPA